MSKAVSRRRESAGHENRARKPGMKTGHGKSPGRTPETARTPRSRTTHTPDRCDAVSQDLRRATAFSSRRQQDRCTQ
ncbi:hypothetical protein STXM2123_3679 [Streptomyces sp. F-3]|nr:hypothetical protein STXM2123_3679 [Streptomyces sp. F-3]